jgi:hypothetical protein
MSEPESSSRFVIPKLWSETVGAVVFTGLIVFFAVLAIADLWWGIAWIPSMLWLVFVFLVIHSGWKKEGFGAYVVSLAGGFSREHFAEIVSKKDGATEIQFCFRFFRYRLLYRAIPVAKIESVEWQTGQASCLAGRDANDWSVALWFDHDDPAKSEKRRKWSRKPDQDIYLVGPPRAKDVTAGFGRAFLSFLERGGAILIQGKDDCAFIRRSKVDGNTSSVS